MNWMRILTVKLTSKNLNKSITFGSNEDDLAIEVNGTKYMSCLQDNFIIRIKNLSYSQMINIIKGQYYTVEVKCGYRNGNSQTIFKGGITYIDNKLDSRKTNTVEIFCASELVAQFSQRRINLSLNSGINMYTAIDYLCKAAGVPNKGIDSSLKYSFINDVVSKDASITSWVDSFAKANPTMIVNADSSLGSILNIFDAARTTKRQVKIDVGDMDIGSGYPRLTSNGLTLTIMPTKQITPGDTINIDNKYIDISGSSDSNNGLYLSKDGNYIVYQISYSLANRDANFSVNLLCKSRELLLNVVK